MYSEHFPSLILDKDCVFMMVLLYDLKLLLLMTTLFLYDNLRFNIMYSKHFLFPDIR